MALLFSHLKHGAASVFQTFGLRDRQLVQVIQAGAWILALALFVGFSSIPVGVMLGLIRP
jgi:succinate dehydrogenase / fumarate reductase cytochrome b subunit